MRAKSSYSVLPTTTTVPLLARLRNLYKMASLAPISTPSVGSSNKKTRGAVRSHFASRPLRRLPPLNLPNANSGYGLVVAWALLVGGFGLASPSTFFSATNFDSVFSSGAILVVLTLGLLPSLAAGELDLSVGSVLGLSMILVAYTNVNLHLPLLLCVVVAIGAGVAIGAINAGLVIGLGINSLIVTLGMGTLLAGIALGVTSLPISGVSGVLVAISTQSVLGLQLSVFYALGLMVALWYVTRYTPLGQYLLFTGANRSVARLSGVRVTALRAWTLVFASGMAAVAGVLAAGTFGAADPTTGPTFLLPAFAAAFLGSTAITPGRFNAVGTWCAVYFLQTGVAGLELLGLSGWVDQAFYGASLIVAVALPRVVRARVAGIANES